MTTTQASADAGRLPDLVERDFTATRPNQLWVSDFTYVATWRGVVYVAFVIDVFARRGGLTHLIHPPTIPVRFTWTFHRIRCTDPKGCKSTLPTFDLAGLSVAR